MEAAALTPVVPVDHAMQIRGGREVAGSGVLDLPILCKLKIGEGIRGCAEVRERGGDQKEAAGLTESTGSGDLRRRKGGFR